VGCCENGNEPSGSIKGRKYFDYLSVSDLVKDSASWSYLMKFYLQDYVGPTRTKIKFS
jgi:hypothetical protein